MRPLYLSVRVATAALAVATVAGCVSVGGDHDGRAKPSHSVKQEEGGEVPDGGTAVGGAFGHRPSGEGGEAGDGLTGKSGRKQDGDTAHAPSPGASASAGPSRSAPAPGGADESAGSAPPGTGEPAPSTTSEPRPTPTGEPSVSPTPEPTTAEPSSSAHEPQSSQLRYREPAPEAGMPA